MSSGNTSYQNPVRGKGEDHIGLLAIAVAVLGTLVGVGLLVGSVWACVVCSKIFYRQRKRHKRQKLGIDGFPQPREMVELGHIPRLPRSADNGPYSINNTGISRSIGIHTSQSAERFPAVPVPKSWTPSPPFAGKHGQTSMYYRKHSSHIPQKNKQEKQARNIKTHSHLKKNIPNNTKGSTSVYHPPYNTHASDVWSVQPAFSNSSSSQSLCSSHPPPEEVDQHFHRNTCSGKNRQTRWRESSMYNKEPFGKCSRHRKKVHAHVHSHKFNECNYGKSNLDEGTEAPDACSSYRDSPQSSHNLISLSQHQQQSHPSRAEASNNYVSYTNPVCSEISDIQKNSAVSSSISRQNMIQIIPKEKRQERSSKYHETPPDPTQSLISTKSRRLWRESCGFKNEVLPKEHTSFHGSGPCWIHHSQPTQRQHRQTEPPPDPLSELSILRETYEQEAFQNIARKYGFCETCGCEISLMQQHEGACGAGRSCVQFKDCDERCESSVDSTPSMSWDNLTPEPTAALTNTQPLQAVSGTNLTHNDKVGNESNADDCCDSFAPPCGSIYTKSCQSGGEG